MYAVRRSLCTPPLDVIERRCHVIVALLNILITIVMGTVCHHHDCAVDLKTVWENVGSLPTAEELFGKYYYIMQRTNNGQQFADNAGPDQPAHMRRLTRPSLPAYRINEYCNTCRWTENVNIRLHGCEHSSGHSLLANDISAFLSTLCVIWFTVLFYGDLVYRFRKIAGKSNFSEQFRKLINRYKRIGYSLDIMRQTACLVVNPIIVDGYASLFNCTTAVRASDSMTASS